MGEWERMRRCEEIDRVGERMKEQRGEDELGEKVERVEVEEIVDRERDSGR